MVPSLPPELKDRIIAFSDRPTQLVCAEVCRSWVPASRTAFFSRQIRVITARSSPRDALIVDILRSPSSTLKQHLTHIHLNGNNALQGLWPQLYPALVQKETGVSLEELAVDIQQTPINLPYFESVAALLVYSADSLHTLTLKVSNWHVGVRLAARIFDRRKLKHLTITPRDPINRPGDDHALLARSIPHSLVSFTTQHVDPTILQSWLQNCPSLSKLSFSISSAGKLSALQSVISTANRSQPELCLAVILDTADVLAGMREFLSMQAVAATIADLDLYFMYSLCLDEKLDLHFAQRLRSFRLMAQVRKTCPNDLGGLEDTLTSISTFQHHKVSIQITAFSGDTGTPLPQGYKTRLDHVLSSFFAVKGSTVKEVRLQVAFGPLLTPVDLPLCTQQAELYPQVVSLHFS